MLSNDGAIAGKDVAPWLAGCCADDIAFESPVCGGAGASGDTGDPTPLSSPDAAGSASTDSIRERFGGGNPVFAAVGALSNVRFNAERVKADEFAMVCQ